MNKRPVVCFAILFYFLNHIIESSIIPLELVFEHRVYLTSLFLFFPIAIWLSQLLRYYKWKNKRMHAVVACFIALLLIGLGSGTFIRNIAWATEKSLWEDALSKAPNSSRPYHNLAWAYYERQGQLEKAMALYRESQRRVHHNIYDNQGALNNIANLYYRQRDYKKATELWEQALAIFPGNEAIRYRMALGYTKRGDFDVAMRHIDKLLSKRQNHAGYLSHKGYLLMKMQRYREALVYLKKCLKLSPWHKKAVINRGASLNQMMEYRSADWALRYAHAHYPQNAITVLWLIDTNMKTGDSVDTDHYLKRLFDLVDVNELVSLLENRRETNFMLSPKSKSLYQKIAAVLTDRATTIVRSESEKIRSSR
jgi:tetratricopeptide (TPR) repeat protein